MQNFLLISQIFLAVIIIATILLQAQGTGLGSSWSGGGETYHTRRGVEKLVFMVTIGAVAAFGLVSLLVLAL